MKIRKKKIFKWIQKHLIVSSKDWKKIDLLLPSYPFIVLYIPRLIISFHLL